MARDKQSIYICRPRLGDTPIGFKPGLADFKDLPNLAEKQTSPILRPFFAFVYTSVGPLVIDA